VAGKLKREKRQGWKYFNVKNPESVADHSFRTALMAAVLGKEAGLDVAKVTKMALVHDLAEAITGDIADSDGVDYEKKHIMEKKAFSEIVLNLPKGQTEEIMGLWLEFEENKTKEARFVWQLDRLEMALQTLEYQMEGQDSDLLEEFYESSRIRLENPLLKEIFAQIIEKRPVQK